MAMTSPFFTLPARTAASSASGMEPAEVFPYSSRLLITLLIGILSFFATVSMMRMLAWCSSSQSTSSAVTPAFSSASPTTSGTREVANLYTSLPTIEMGAYVPVVTDATDASGRSAPAYPRQRSGRPAPFECSAKPSTPSSPSPSTAACSTTAPAPSPNKTHVLRSLQSTQRERASAPMTSAVLYAPVCRNCDAVVTPKRKPEHAAVRSKATAPVAPTSRATCAASPNRSSGLEVASTTSSTEAASTPLLSSAFCAARAASVERPSPGASRWRCRMPVRWEIQSSEVSTTDESCSLVTTVSGAAEPMPTRRERSAPR
mmetsp:Transcript_18855/g.55749  ORF Transcript_18855/g.55749 Transcript_18855/m.55749 type:complete len:317 (+) Transcript_18855:366-1316(+)